MKRLYTLISKIAKLNRNQYTKGKGGTSAPNVPIEKREEAIDMTQFVKKIHNINLPPHQMRELGLSDGWQKEVSPQYIEKVVKTAERFKKDLKELSKR